MRDRFGVEVRTEHYVYMVKLLGMGGRLGEAYDLVMSLTQPVDSGVRGALLSCCEHYKNYEVHEAVTKHFSKNESISSGDSVMLSNSFAHVGRVGMCGAAEGLMGPEPKGSCLCAAGLLRRSIKWRRKAR